MKMALMQRVIRDLADEVPDTGYTAEMKELRREVGLEFDEWKRTHPYAILHIPVDIEDVPSKERFSGGWWERPQRNSEQRFLMSGGKDGLDAILEHTHSVAEDLYRSALAKLKTQIKGWIKSPKVSPRQILRNSVKMGLDLDEFEDALVEGAKLARDFGIKQASKELKMAGAKKINLPPDARERFDFEDQIAPDDPYQLGNFVALMEARAFQVRRGYEDKTLRILAEFLMTQNQRGIIGPEAVSNLDKVFQKLERSGQITVGKSSQNYTKPAVQETTIITMAASAFNSARQDLYERNDDFVLGYSISEVAGGLDYNQDGSLRSHPLSQHLHGITIKLSDPRARLLVPPNAYRDRAVQIAETVLDEPIAWSTDAEIDEALAWKAKLSPNFS